MMALKFSMYKLYSTEPILVGIRRNPDHASEQDCFYANHLVKLGMDIVN